MKYFLILLGLFLHYSIVWGLIGLYFSSVGISAPAYTYSTQLPFEKFMMGVFFSGFLGVIYSAVLFISYVIFRLLGRESKRILKFAVITLLLSGVIISWQWILPCRYTPIGCLVTNSLLIPSAR